MISQANRRPEHAAYLSAIRSKPFAPIFTFQICSVMRKDSNLALNNIIPFITLHYKKSLFLAAFLREFWLQGFGFAY